MGGVGFVGVVGFVARELGEAREEGVHESELRAGGVVTAYGVERARDLAGDVAGEELVRGGGVEGGDGVGSGVEVREGGLEVAREDVLVEAGGEGVRGRGHRWRGSTDGVTRIRWRSDAEEPTLGSNAPIALHRVVQHTTRARCSV